VHTNSSIPVNDQRRLEPAPHIRRARCVRQVIASTDTKNMSREASKTPREVSSNNALSISSCKYQA
jgi:hypothetical protein